MAVLIKNELCSGCGACEAVCPCNAIVMVKNKEGFEYPKICDEQCVDCKQCENVCKIVSNMDLKTPTAVYSAKNRNKKILYSSSSGGVFTELAKWIIENKGAVVGAIFENGKGVYHTIIDTLVDIDKMRGSKYVQSKISKEIFEKVKLHLENEKYVLFVGTPCQISGIKGFLEKDYERLLTIDLVCHGVPSPGFFNEYISWKEKKLNDKILEINFRSKAKVHKGIYNVINFKLEKTEKNIYAWADPYYMAYAKTYNYRECCYKCRYSNINRVGDLTIGDYWGVHKKHCEFENDKGVSLVMVNSDRAERIWNDIEERFEVVKSDKKFAEEGQSSLRKSANRNSERNIFYNNINTYGFDKWANQYFFSKSFIKSFIICMLGYCIPLGLRKDIKKMLRKK